MTMAVKNSKLATLGSKVTYVGGGTALLGGATSTDIAAVGGLCVAIIGLIVQWYYRSRDEHRKQEIHIAEMAGKIKVSE